MPVTLYKAPPKAKSSKKLIELYQQMYDHTRPICMTKCAPLSEKFGCCHEFYCGQTVRFAKEKYGVDLVPPEDPMPGVPMLSQSRGCVVAPHLRPICTIHACPALFDEQHDNVPPEWHERYQQLNDAIEELDDIEAHVPVY